MSVMIQALTAKISKMFSADHTLLVIIPDPSQNTGLFYNFASS